MNFYKKKIQLLSDIHEKKITTWKFTTFLIYQNKFIQN